MTCLRDRAQRHKFAEDGCDVHTGTARCARAPAGVCWPVTEAFPEDTMKEVLSALLDRYESGEVSRRQLLETLAVVAGAAQLATAAAAAPTFQGVGLNHIALAVADIGRSKEFYQKHFGFPLISESATSCFLKVGDEFLTLFKRGPVGLDHYCYAVENFDPDAAMETLNRLGMKPRRAGGTDRVYFPDPDGITVQIAAKDHMA
jgi:catechol 2,3-dioxygenase-like lactoylglutathione lyase family enzyme